MLIAQELLFTVKKLKLMTHFSWFHSLKCCNCKRSYKIVQLLKKMDKNQEMTLYIDVIEFKLNDWQQIKVSSWSHLWLVFYRN